MIRNRVGAVSELPQGLVRKGVVAVAIRRYSNGLVCLFRVYIEGTRPTGLASLSSSITVFTPLYRLSLIGSGP